MTRDLRGIASIIGVGTTDGWFSPGLNAMDQMAVAVSAACADAGIAVSDIDGLFVSTLTEFLPAMSAAEYLGIRPAVLEGTNIGGSSFVAYLLPALLALQAGVCKVACICYGSNQRSAGGKLTTMTEPSRWELPYQPRNPVSGYAFAAARHFHQYGTTRRDLAEVAVAARKWAQLNPEATARDPLTIEDVLGARMISDPLSVLDACLVTDGGGAVIVTLTDRAQDHGNRAVPVLGVGMATTHRQISSMPDLTVTAAAQSGPAAYAMAGLKPSDIDIVQLYDAFTINTLLFLEDLGFCAKGEGGAFVSGGAIAPGGRLPVNTNGGGLSCCHPGMYSIFTLIENVRQLRGEAGERQVSGLRFALSHGNGGQLSSQATAILGHREVL